jgi:hypothetical protein
VFLLVIQILCHGRVRYRRPSLPERNLYHCLASQRSPTDEIKKSINYMVHMNQLRHESSKESVDPGSSHGGLISLS